MISLGLLPSGPDPIGKQYARANLPGGDMGERAGKGKGGGNPNG
jgi:hypothetical protein